MRVTPLVGMWNLHGKVPEPGRRLSGHKGCWPVPWAGIPLFLALAQRPRPAWGRVISFPGSTLAAFARPLLPMRLLEKPVPVGRFLSGRHCPVSGPMGGTGQRPGLNIGSSIKQGLHHIRGFTLRCRKVQGGTSTLVSRLNVGPGLQAAGYMGHCHGFEVRRRLRCSFLYPSFG